MIVFISCGKSKNKNATIAQELYIGDLFKKSLRYARQKTSDDKIFILSAKYGLLSLGDSVDYYEKTLNNAGKKEQKQWAYRVLMQMKEKKISLGEQIIVAGRNYYRYIIQKLPNAQIPFRGLSFGRLLSALKKSVL